MASFLICADQTLNVHAGSLTVSIGEAIYFAQVGARQCRCLPGTNHNSNYLEKLDRLHAHLHLEDVDMDVPPVIEKEGPAVCLAIRATTVAPAPVLDPALGLAQDTMMIVVVPPNGEGLSIVHLLDPVRGQGPMIAREDHPGVTLQITLDLGLPLEIVEIGPKSKKMKKSSSAPWPRRSWSTGKGLREL